MFLLKNWSEMRDTTRTAVALSIGLAVSFIGLLAVQGVPDIWNSGLTMLKQIAAYNKAQPGSVANVLLLSMFAALTLIAFLREWKSSFSRRVQLGIYVMLQTSLAVGILAILHSVTPSPRHIEVNPSGHDEILFMLLFGGLTFIALGGLIYQVYSLYLQADDRHKWSPYGMTKLLSVFCPLALLLFDWTWANAAWTLGLWFMLGALPQDHRVRFALTKPKQANEVRVE